jgi:hypothetical protein
MSGRDCDGTKHQTYLKPEPNFETLSLRLAVNFTLEAIHQRELMLSIKNFLNVGNIYPFGLGCFIHKRDLGRCCHISRDPRKGIWEPRLVCNQSKRVERCSLRQIMTRSRAIPANVQTACPAEVRPTLGMTGATLLVFLWAGGVGTRLFGCTACWTGRSAAQRRRACHSGWGKRKRKRGMVHPLGGGKIGMGEGSHSAWYVVTPLETGAWIAAVFLKVVILALCKF